MSIGADAEWARRTHSLKTFTDRAVLRLSGRVIFRAFYNGDLLVYGNSIPGIVLPDKIIEDSWPIILIHNYQNSEQFPIVFDASDRLSRSQKKHSIFSHQDMHLNDQPPRSFCVAPRSELLKTYVHGFDLEHYFSHYLLPFLFQQSYFEKYGDWPWWNYPHGAFGEYIWKIEQRIGKGPL
jgi:hypothetical protein